MIYKWNEINYENFKEVLDGYSNQAPWSVGKILEVQNVFGLVASPAPHEERTYFGHGIRLSDWKSTTDPTTRILNLISQQIGYKDVQDMIDKDKTLTMCLLSKQTPLISPLYNKFDLLSFIKRSMFGDRGVTLNKTLLQSPAATSLGMVSWYTRDKITNKIQLHLNSNDIDYTDQERLIRCRSIDYSDWKTNIKEYVRSGNISYTKGDIDPAEISIYSQSDPVDKDEIKKLIEEIRNGNKKLDF